MMNKLLAYELFSKYGIKSIERLPVIQKIRFEWEFSNFKRASEKSLSLDLLSTQLYTYCYSLTGQRPFINTLMDTHQHDSMNTDATTSVFVDITNKDSIRSFLTSLFQESCLLEVHELKYSVIPVGKNLLVYNFLVPQVYFLESNTTLSSLLPNINSKDFMIKISIYIRPNGVPISDIGSINTFRDNILLCSKAHTVESYPQSPTSK